ncbi:MAG TPA: hypothetical protein VKB88_45300 [Bryobacteraceae bacterium]|nr:hypothetical protein [Bryobacteraceae bacterium]
MKPFVFLLLPLICAAAIPHEMAAVIDMARQAPGEFGADALIRVAATEKLDKPVRVQLLEEAFRRAAEAQQPYKRQASILRVGGTAGFLQHAYQQNLDALSLRLRAVEAMLPLDHAKARSLFLEIPPLQPPKITCDDYLIYNVKLFYEVLGKVAQQSFSAQEAATGEPVQLLERYVSAIDSAAEVEPAAHMLAEGGIENKDFATLTTALGASLGRISGDDRTFTATVSPASQQILALLENARRREVSALALVEGYRLYLVNNLSGPRCSDDDLVESGQSYSMTTGGPASGMGTAAADYFNQKLAKPPILPLREEEVTPAKIEGAATGLRSCQAADCKDLATQYRSLIFDASGTPLPPAKKDTAEWRVQLQQFLNSLANWKEAGGTDSEEREQFRDKCAMFGSLLGVIPPGPDSERVLLAWLDYLQGSRVAQDDRVGWFLPVNTLIGRVAMDPLGLGKLTEALRKTPNPVIALYIELEHVAPRTPDQILPLM